MKIEEFKKQLKQALKEVLSEGHYSNSVTPVFGKTDMLNNLGKNPLYVDNGNHTPSDVLLQPSLVDYNGANFKGQHIVLSDNKFIIYKIKNFGTDKIASTLSLFGNSPSSSEKGLRAAIDTINGAAYRNSKTLLWRTITSESNRQKSQSSGHMTNTFWEFSLDGGSTWCIMRPRPSENMQVSKLIQKS